MIATIESLREISRRCQTAEPLDEELAQWLGEALERFLAHSCRTIDEAFGLCFPQGGVPWWMEEAIRTRDEALRAFGGTLDPDLSTTARAREVRALTLRYAASAWRHDRERDELPATYAGTPKELIWRAFKSGAAMPLGERQLRTILG
ncbi:MAG: hypothetical protein OEQ29_10290 [Alphaproteobacteria bacterium]|nr:hypothetical protein [Alphaproteobacteria bacterium]